MPTLLVLEGSGDSRGGSAGTYLPVYLTAGAKDHVNS